MRIHIPDVVVRIHWHASYKIKWIPSEGNSAVSFGRKYRFYYWLKYQIEFVTHE
jgi:hypothetical protein